jgi:hypothetical protein
LIPQNIVLSCVFRAIQPTKNKMDALDAQVLTQLRVKKARLMVELERVNIAIKAFENIRDIDPLDALPYLMDEVVDDVDELAIATLMYNPKSTIEKKIQFVLSKITRGDARDITEYITKIDKSVEDVKALYDRVTYVSSRLYRLGKLSAQREGKKNVYWLKV